METQREPSDRAYELALDWMKSYREVAERKGAALIRNDLAALEQCVDETARLISQYSELIEMTDVDRGGSQSPQAAMRKAIAQVAVEIRGINRRNAVLIEAGLELSRMMRGADTSGFTGSSEPTFSLEC
jgi:hypothetical protein